MNSITLSEKDTARFWAKVKIGNPDECWEWQGTKSQDGYGQFSIGSRKTYRSVRPNRVSLTLYFGEIQENLYVCHHCDNPSCVNPNHLFLGTAKDNSLDMSRKGRTGISLGEKHGLSKLKEKDIPVINQMLRDKISQQTIASVFGVSQYAISKIKRKITWSWMK